MRFLCKLFGHDFESYGFWAYGLVEICTRCPEHRHTPPEQHGFAGIED